MKKKVARSFRGISNVLSNPYTKMHFVHRCRTHAVYSLGINEEGEAHFDPLCPKATTVALIAPIRVRKCSPVILSEARAPE